MKLIFAFLLSFIAIVLAADKDMYTDKYDAMDIDEMLGNKRLLSAYIKCILDKGKCTPEGKELKVHITDALQTGCSKCTPAQRNATRKVIHHLIHEENESWQELVEKYDPKKIYTHKYEAQLKSVLDD